MLEEKKGAPHTTTYWGCINLHLPGKQKKLGRQEEGRTLLGGGGGGGDNSPACWEGEGGTGTGTVSSTTTITVRGGRKRVGDGGQPPVGLCLQQPFWEDYQAEHIPPLTALLLLHPSWFPCTFWFLTLSPSSRFIHNNIPPSLNPSEKALSLVRFGGRQWSQWSLVGHGWRYG